MIEEIQKRDIPRDLAIEKKHRERFKELTDEDSSSPFAGQQMSKLFIVSLGIGYDQGIPKSIDDRAANIPWSALSPNEQWVIKSVAVKKAEDPHILKDGRQVAKIAEEYANGGFDHINEVIKGPKDALSTLRTETITMHKNQVPEEKINLPDDD